MVRGVRGATTVAVNRADAIVDAAAELLAEMIEANGIIEDEVASVIFTSTPDLDAGFPAPAGRKVGWSRVALLGMQELGVPGATERTVRILIHWNTGKGLDDIVHVYLHGAQALRPDLTQRRQALQSETVGIDPEGDRS
ncbi:MAG: chorismate mutase [Chloroflexi bacterium]|nr:chorismate mutase [Chloroflexota bacterium]